MTDSNLPDDPAQWPSDSFALLGVDRQVDRRELRRAYTRLIRRFKPEHFPAQFRRIRDAYESLEQYLQHQGLANIEIPAHAGQPTADPLAAQAPSDAKQSGEGPGATDAAGPPSVSVDPAAAAWEHAVDGHRMEAYDQLRQLVQQQSHDAELYARLYWLLLLYPKLDAQRDRREWLAAGLAATGFDGRLAELYEREFQGDPEEVLRPRCRRLLDCRSPLPRWARFTARCWEYAGLLGHWETIAEDQLAVREAVAGADRAVWARLLLVAAEQFLWQTDPRARNLLVQSCRGELDGFAEEHQELSQELDRFDYLVVFTAECRKLSANRHFRPEFADGLRDLLRRSWVHQFNVIQSDLIMLLRPLVESPCGKGIGDLDFVRRISPAILHHLNSLVETLYHHRHDPGADAGADDLLAPVEEFLRARNWLGYEQVRPEILLYCVRSRITLDQFETAAEKISLPLQKRGLPKKLRGDLPLRCLATACQAFWS
jgi:hypothetical protein